MKRFDSKDMCGAWRCDEFLCDCYDPTRYDCEQGHCHVCSRGHSCSSCENAPECEEAKHNIAIQNLSHSSRGKKKQKRAPDINVGSREE